MERNLRIAVFGQKRLSREGGVEIVVKELCTRMAQQGCQVTCYNRSGHHVSGAEYDDIDNTNYDGIRQKHVPTIEKKGALELSFKSLFVEKTARSGKSWGLYVGGFWKLCFDPQKGAANKKTGG